MAAPKPPVRTEDLGKIFEMAICLLYNTPYDGHYRYDLAPAQTLVPKLQRLKELFPACTHTAKGGGVYDYTAVADTTQHLSAKTTKRGGKIAPQLVGQAQPAAFCERLGLPQMEVPALKTYIQENLAAKILPVLERNTFSCPTIYYNENTGRLAYVIQKSPIDWSKPVYTWTRPAASWTNSCTFKADGVSILEVQFHSSSRTNMAVRWCYENVLRAFAPNFAVTEL
jgi:hypothetical protein